MNEEFYNVIKKILISARNKVYQTANFAMVEAYWNIGKSIIEEPVSYTHLRAHETGRNLVCRLLLEKKKK